MTKIAGSGSTPKCYRSGTRLLAIQGHLYSFALRFIFLSSNSSNLLQFLYCVTVHCKGGKTEIKPHPLPYGLRNPYSNLKSENSHDYAQKPRRNCTVHSWIRLLATLLEPSFHTGWHSPFVTAKRCFGFLGRWCSVFLCRFSCKFIKLPACFSFQRSGVNRRASEDIYGGFHQQFYEM